MHNKIKHSLAIACLTLALPALAQVTFYEREGFGGRSFSTPSAVSNLSNQGFNDRASSVVVKNDSWEVCEDARFSGRCRVLRQGRYASLSAMGMNDRISSVRRVSAKMRVAEERYAPSPYRLPNDVADYRQRKNERLFEADVVEVHAVVGPAEQRCWVERQQVEAPAERGPANVGGAVIGGVLGGILGHQIGGGFGKDLATVGGVAAGAAVGANVGRDKQGNRVVTREVQRCANTAAPTRPQYWDVTYTFRGVDHRVQMTSAPGATVTVNRDGIPRS